jgi:hypothetical protein
MALDNSSLLERIIGWHAATTRTTELVLTCLRMAT